jgi:hypothetical protein
VKKHLLVIVMVLAMLAMFTGTAAAAPLASGSVSLVNVTFVQGKGMVFTFQVSGHYSKSDLQGTLHVVGGEDFSLSCEQVDANTVTCTISKVTENSDVVLSWGGFTFWTHTPRTSICYGIWDWAPPTPTSTSWVEYGSHCQEHEANAGDSFIWNNPFWGPSLYEFGPQSPSCFPSDVIGDGYYYPGCPNSPL